MFANRQKTWALGLVGLLALAACVAPGGGTPAGGGKASTKPTASSPRALPSQGSLPSRDPLASLLSPAPSVGSLASSPSPGLIASPSPGGGAAPLLSFAGTFILDAGGKILSNHGAGIIGNNASGFHPTVAGALSASVASLQNNAGLISDAGSELLSGDGGVDFYRLLAVGDAVLKASRSAPALDRATFEAVFPDGNASRVVAIRHTPVSVQMELVKGSQATVEGRLSQLAVLTGDGVTYESRLVESLWRYEGSPLGATALELLNPDGSLAISRPYPPPLALAAEPTASGTYTLRLKGPLPADAYAFITFGGRTVYRRAGQDGQVQAPTPDGWSTPGAELRLRAFLPADTAASAAVLRHAYYLGGGRP